MTGSLSHLLDYQTIDEFSVRQRDRSERITFISYVPSPGLEKPWLVKGSPSSASPRHGLTSGQVTAAFIPKRCVSLFTLVCATIEAKAPDSNCHYRANSHMTQMRHNCTGEKPQHVTLPPPSKEKFRPRNSDTP